MATLGFSTVTEQHEHLRTGYKTAMKDDSNSGNLHCFVQWYMMSIGTTEEKLLCETTYCSRHSCILNSPKKMKSSNVCCQHWCESFVQEDLRYHGWFLLCVGLCTGRSALELYVFLQMMNHAPVR